MGALSDISTVFRFTRIGRTTLEHGRQRMDHLPDVGVHSCRPQSTGVAAVSDQFVPLLWKDRIELCPLPDTASSNPARHYLLLSYVSFGYLSILYLDTCFLFLFDSDFNVCSCFYFVSLELSLVLVALRILRTIQRHNHHCHV